MSATFAQLLIISTYNLAQRFYFFVFTNPMMQFWAITSHATSLGSFMCLAGIITDHDEV